MRRDVYSEESRKAAVEQVIVPRHTVRSVAQRLGIGYGTIRKWVERTKVNSNKSLIPTDLLPPPSSASTNSRRRTHACAWNGHPKMRRRPTSRPWKEGHRDEVCPHPLVLRPLRRGDPES